MAARKISRRRGAILTVAGYQKLQAARTAVEAVANVGRYTNEDLSKLTRLSLNTIVKIFGGIPASTTNPQIPVDKQSLSLCFAAFKLILERGDYLYPTSDPAESQDSDSLATGVDLPISNPQLEALAPVPVPQQIADRSSIIDWGEAPDVSVFYGRERELTQLEQWLQVDRCKLVIILGMGGIGKTALVTKLTQQLQSEFKTIIWRSLRNAPLLTDLIPELIQIFSRQSETVSPTLDVSSQISRLIHYLRQERCLLVLDNAEAIIQSQSNADRHQSLGYQELLRRIGESSHQSCLLLTSREKPEVIVPLEGERLAVRTLAILGLNVDDSENLFNAKGLSISAVGRARLLEIYSGNPLALNIVATSISDLFDGNIDRFLQTQTVVFNGIQQLLDLQFEQLTPTEQAVMYWLAIERDWISPAELQAQIVPATTMQRVLSILERLGRKSLIEHHRSKFIQQAVVMEYLTARLIDQVTSELTDRNFAIEGSAQLPLWLSHPLMKAQSPKYIRTAQTQLILTPIANQLQSQFVNRAGLERHLHAVLDRLRNCYPDKPHYGGGNLINLLRHWQIAPANYSFANLPVWQADLQDAILHDVNFSGADLAKSLFTETFGWITAIAFSPDSQILATGELKGDLCLWHVDRKHLFKKLIGHNSWIWAISFSPDGRTVASAGLDATVRLWDVETGKVSYILRVDGDPAALSLCFHASGQSLLSGHADGKIRSWNVVTGELVETQSVHTQKVYSIDFSPNGQFFATSSDEVNVKIWDFNTRDLLQNLIPQQGVPSLKFSLDGKFLATGTIDGAIQLWDVNTWTVFAVFGAYPDWPFTVCISPDSQMLAVSNSQNEVKIWDLRNTQVDRSQSPVAIATLSGHHALVSCLQFSPDGRLLVTAGTDRSVRLWDTCTWQELYQWKGYSNGISSMAFDPKDSQLVTGTQYGNVCRWDVQTGEILETLTGYRQGILSVDYHPQGKSIASANTDSQVKVWDAQTGKLLHTCSAHEGQVWKVRFSPDGRLLASSGMENTICLWSETGELVSTLIGQPTVTRALVFSPDSKLLATGCFDGCWRLWDLATEQIVGCYQAHSNWIWNLASSPDGRMLASCSADCTAKLWEIATGELLRTYTGHAHEVLSIEFSPDGQHLATGSGDRTIKIWDVETGQVVRTLSGHLDRVWTLTYSHDGRILASGSMDETVILWDVASGELLRRCKLPAPYMGMNITGATGLTPAAIESLRALGAIFVPST